MFKMKNVFKIHSFRIVTLYRRNISVIYICENFAKNVDNCNYNIICVKSVNKKYFVL